MNLAQILAGGAGVTPGLQQLPTPVKPPPPMQPLPAQQGEMPAPQLLPEVPPAAPPTPAPEAVETPQSKWQGVLTSLKDPNVMEPLQTFFSALAAPLQPWETAGSRIGRAGMLMQMHKNMLATNAAQQPIKDEMQQLELRKARAEVEGAETDNQYKASTLDVRIKSAQQELENAVLAGDVNKEKLAEAKLSRALAEKFGEDKAKMELASERALIEQRRASAARDRVGASADMIRARADATRAADSPEDKVWSRQVRVAQGLVNGAIERFRMTNPGGTEQQFHQWVTQQSMLDPSLGEFYNSLGIVRGEGQDPLAALRSPAPAATAPAVVDAAAIRARLSQGKAQPTPQQPSAQPQARPQPQQQPRQPPKYKSTEEQGRERQMKERAVAALKASIAAKGVEMQQALQRGDLATMNRLRTEMGMATAQLNALTR